MERNYALIMRLWNTNAKAGKCFQQKKTPRHGPSTPLRNRTAQHNALHRGIGQRGFKIQNV